MFDSQETPEDKLSVGGLQRKWFTYESVLILKFSIKSSEVMSASNFMVATPAWTVN